MKVSMITGASSGIGEAFAMRLAKENHNLLLIARSEDKLKALCGRLKNDHNITAQYIAADLAKEGSHRLIAEEIARRNLEVDWLINNAGIGAGGDILEYPLEFYQNLMRLNMEALVALTWRFLPEMRARRSGTIINVGSMAGFGPIPYMGIYAASKAFVKCFTEALWEENRLYNVRTMLLCPGATETNFFSAAKIDGERKASFSTKKLETPGQVVEAAMDGLAKGNTTTISGLQNKILHRLVSVIPTKAGLKFWGNMMRKNLNLSVK